MTAHPSTDDRALTRSPDVDAFLAKLPADARATLEGLRRTIAAAAPETVESINYGVPAFKLRGRPFVSFGAGKRHLSFYVQSPAVMEAHREDLASYSTSKGTVHFAPGAPLPEELVRKLVRARIVEIDAARK
jgi:uncharacterized protein YdhG (YjbR/CyaY superfamily)